MAEQIVREVVDGEWRTTFADGGGGSQTIEQVTRPFTAAEIADSLATPIEIVPAPGAGYVLVPTTFTWIYRAGDTQNGEDGNLNIDWDGTSIGLITVVAALMRTDDRISIGALSVESRKVLDTAEDKALVVSIDIEVASGDGTGFAILQYTTMPLAP